MNAFYTILDAYYNMFGDIFPLMDVYGMDEDEIIKIVKECIDTGTPYKSEMVGDDIHT